MGIKGRNHSLESGFFVGVQIIYNPVVSRVQKTYTVLSAIHYDNENMKGDERIGIKGPIVNFSIEVRKPTFDQLEAGKRLFKRLVARVQSTIPEDKGK
ncbi:hypothetical protein ACFLU7_00495 [Chloroflexota bacterium]